MRMFLNAMKYGLVFFYGLLGISIEAAGHSLRQDAFFQEDIPKGTLHHDVFYSEIFEGTRRDYWVYVPAQYNADKAACLMVFNDGSTYLSEAGSFRVPIVFDNLIHRGEIPVIIGLFVNPGEVPSAEPGQAPRRNRSFEYDSLGGMYARFLLEEMIPQVASKYNLTHDPRGRAICGISSGGIAAFTVAWERPDVFTRVVSHIGSFVNIRGGHAYPFLIRKTKKKPLKVFLQEGSNDLDNLHGHWPLGNQEMAAALQYLAYEYRFVMGDGGHDGRHGGAILPDTLRWLWGDFLTP